MELSYEDIGKRIRRIRENKGLKQDEIAARAGISIQHYGNIERGQTKLSLEALVRIANALGVTTDQLLCGSSYRAKEVLKDDLAELVSGASDAEMRVILKITEASLGIFRRDYREKESWD